MVIFHVAVQFPHKRIIWIDRFEILFRISYEKLIKQAVILVSGIYLQFNICKSGSSILQIKYRFISIDNGVFTGYL
jgi:hypothetical protein